MSAVRHASFIALKALSPTHSSGRRANPVQFRVGDPFRNRASAQAGFISQHRRGQHSGLRPTFALSSHGSAGHFRAASINE